MCTYISNLKVKKIKKIMLGYREVCLKIAYLWLMFQKLLLNKGR